MTETKAVYQSQKTEVATLMNVHDWSKSELGMPSLWPQPLRIVSDLLIVSKFPMFVAWGPKLNLIYNDAYAEILGNKHPTAIGKPFNEIWPEIWNELTPIITHAMSGEVSFFENLPLIVNRNGNPEEAWFTFSYSPVRDEVGQIAGIFCAVTETTKQVLAERELSETSRRKDEFLAMLSHELRNPLAPISAASQLLSTAKLDEAQLKKTSQIISRQVHHLNQLLEDLLDVSRVTRGIVSLSKSEQDFKEVVKNAVEQILPLLEEKTHQFVLNLTSESAYIFGDKDRLVQVVANLLHNAAKYTPSQGRIRIDLKVIDNTVVLIVSDNGIGISKDFQPQIFDLFSQAERTSDRTQGGLGLGLALVSKIVDLHDGEVSCESLGLGQGSSFTVSFPRIISCKASAESSDMLADEFDGPNKLKILVVDDNIDAATSLQMLLETIGHEAFAVNDPYAALEKASNELPDVIILDIGLPEIDGYEVAKRIRQIPGVCESKLIALTGYGQEDDLKKAIDAGFDHHLVKPLDFDNLIKILEKCEARIISFKGAL
jgi:PAS domain S-box-containing protein